MKDVPISDEALPAEQTRRRFLQLAALSVSLLAFLLPGATQAAGKTEALLLSCMDYRLTHHTEQYMSSRGLREKYDHIVLAGAALGAITKKYPAWNKTFWEHLDIAIQLHAIHKVMVLDHRDCGAYKVILGEDFAKDPAKERGVHASQLKQLASLIKQRYPKLEIELLLMSLDGKVETIS